MAAPVRIKMPARDDGTPVPNPIRYMCDRGHVHPSHRAAATCNRKHREREGRS